MINKKDILIYCVYHDSFHIYEYNLNKIPDYVKLFYVNDFSMPGDNINYLNPYLSELVAYYYIWKNNIYSPYVGFCHYRRWYKNLGLDNLDKYGVHYLCFSSITINDLKFGYVKKYLYRDIFENIDKLYEYLCKSNKFDKDYLDKYFLNDEQINFPWKLSYIMKWEHFMNICEIVFGFLEYLLPKYRDINFYTCDEHGYFDYNNKYDSDYKNYIKGTWRKWAFEFEIFVGIIVCLYFNNLKLNNTNNSISKYIIVSESDNKFDCMKWMMKNRKTSMPLYIITNNKDINKDYFEFINNYDDIYAIKNINEISKKNNEQIIKLNIDEYIDCLDPIDFLKGNYKIKNIYE